MTLVTVYCYCVLTVYFYVPACASVCRIFERRKPLWHKGKPAFARESGRWDNFNADLTTS